VEPIEVLSGSRDVLNLRCRHISFGGITRIKDWKQVTDVYAKAQQGQPAIGKKKVKFTQHCEITLALDMLKRKAKFTHSKIEIGVSKACCEWCCDYLTLLGSAYSHHSILVRASHGKQTDGWMMPSHGPKSIEHQMAQLIETRIQGVVWKIHSRRRSDSPGLPLFTRVANVEDRGQDSSENWVQLG
jgi:hypothetical protein